MDLILFNKILITKNFYIMEKYLNIDNFKKANTKVTSTQNKIHYLFEKCLISLFETFKKSEKLDSMSFLLMTMIHNM